MCRYLFILRDSQRYLLSTFKLRGNPTGNESVVCEIRNDFNIKF